MTACYPCLRPFADNKFEPRSLLYVFLGYSPQYKGYCCLYPPTGKVYISRHVIFDESVFPFRDQYKKFVPRYETTLLKTWQQATSSAETRPAEQISRVLPAPAPVAPVPAPVAPAPVLVQQAPAPNPPVAPAPVAPPVVDAAVNQHPMQTRTKSGIHKQNTRYVLAASKFDLKTPQSIHEAMAHPDWSGAVTDEIVKVHTLHTWSLVPQTPEMNVLTSEWVYTYKTGPDGQKFPKARLVAKGYRQEEGINYLETFSPVVRTAAIRLTLNVATAKDWSIKQLDVSSAFLHGELSKLVYMHQPDGFVDPQRPHHVCCLTKALYGLKQAPRAWFDTFSNYLIGFGFKCSRSDSSLFTYHKDKKTLVLLLYVDDILLKGSD